MAQELLREQQAALAWEELKRSDQKVQLTLERERTPPPAPLCSGAHHSCLTPSHQRQEAVEGPPRMQGLTTGKPGQRVEHD